MPDAARRVDFSESACIIPFVYRDIGADRDIPQVYWDNTKWVQVSYDTFREQWSGSQPILYGGAEALAVHFHLDPDEWSIDEIAVTPPDSLSAKGTASPESGIILLQGVTRYARWFDSVDTREYLAERFSSGRWSLACLDAERYRWDIESVSLEVSDINRRYTDHLHGISFLGGLPPSLSGSID